MSKPGEAFESQCYLYLTQNYGNANSRFRQEGGMNATKSDIAVIQNGKIAFFIEAKDTAAQSGQFVLFPDEEHEVFIFSHRNHSDPNSMTDTIIEYMNADFHKFNHAGTAGTALDIDSSVFSKWIIDYYIKKDVKYVISYGEDYVILPIRKFEDYFDISAKYRVKKSGSASPAKRDFTSVKQKISQLYPSASFETHSNKLFVKLTTALSSDRFQLGKYTYYFSAQAPGFYEIRRLSNTYNMNVIFSIKLTKSQAIEDLSEFVADL